MKTVTSPSGYYEGLRKGISQTNTRIPLVYQSYLGVLIPTLRRDSKSMQQRTSTILLRAFRTDQSLIPGCLCVR